MALIYTIDTSSFDNINSETKAFWLGFCAAHSSFYMREPTHLVTLSCLNVNSYKDFCQDFKSNYKLTGDAVRINRSTFYFMLKAAIENKFNIIQEFNRYFISGFLSSKGTVRQILPKNEKLGKSYATWTLEIQDEAMVNFIHHVFTENKIAFDKKVRNRKNKDIYVIRICKSSELIKLFNLINIKETFILYGDTVNKLKEITNSFIKENTNKDILFSMIQSDYKNNLSITNIASKYSIRYKLAKRIISTSYDFTNSTTNATGLLEKLNLTKCPKCQIYTDNLNDCIYCKNSKYILRKQRSSEAAKKDYTSQIRAGLRKLLNNKNVENLTIQKYTGWTFNELKLHIESLFEPWMNWDNWKNYSARRWDDNDSSTWVWNIDHVKPQSLFEYKDKTCQEFKQCWALENLRPYSAKQNIIDGAEKNRH